ncbi:MAG: transposase family protein [Holophaga sp.]|nr:transposase family protein [Holophaga sp.]
MLRLTLVHSSCCNMGNGKKSTVNTCHPLALPNGIPSHDTFDRIFRMLNPRAISEVFLDWVRGIRDKIPIHPLLLG